MMVGDNIKALIEIKDTTQGAVARVAGVSDSAVSLWISGQNDPTLKYLLKIADYYGVSIDDLRSDSNGLASSSRDVKIKPVETDSSARLEGSEESM